MDTVENYRFIINIFMEGLLEVNGVIRPMHTRFEVMGDMVTIVPALMVVLGIDTGYAVFIRIPRIMFTNERMLCPITHHHDDPGYDERQYKYDERGPEIHEA